ncbi:tektin-4-like isoform X2 [Venturia canescens]|uniref:tektin-4-like isoform X2 n=1 Tax=Venturia canescens TaxID=32260 RepID=UPI001C9C7272|nr:tektin-4-like isoform X2 [Venturia canescens]
MLDRPCLDAKCATKNPSRVPQFRTDVDDNEIGKKSPRIEPCGFQNFPKISNQAARPTMMDTPAVNGLEARCSESENATQAAAPAYFPQPEDALPRQPEGPMGAIGPWATGRVTYNRTNGMTGIRPVVDRYSITKYSASQWRAHNRNFFDQTNARIATAEDMSRKSKFTEINAQIYKETDSHQLENRDRLSKRAGVVYGWKAELERAWTEMVEEIELLEGERRRVKQSLSVLTIPESIAGDLLQLRTCRMEPDLVRDAVEDELVKEVALCSEIRNTLVDLRERIETQLVELKTAKSRMEFDFTDKRDAYETESSCIHLNNDSPVILIREGATRIPPEQTTPAGYDHFTRESLEAGEDAKRKSVDLRSSLDVVYSDGMKNLRSQAMAVDRALAEKIHVTEECCQQLETTLVRCLAQLSSTEAVIEELRGAAKKVKDALKVAQTRLDYRLQRRNVESCRDVPQYGYTCSKK